MEKMGAGEDNGGSGQDLILRPFLSIFLLFPVFFSLAVEGGAAFFNLLLEGRLFLSRHRGGRIRPGELPASLLFFFYSSTSQVLEFSSHWVTKRGLSSHGIPSSLSGLQQRQA